LSAAIALVMSFTVDTKLTYQCDASGERASVGLEERARETRERVWVLGVAGGRVANGQDDPVGAKLECSNLRSCQIAVVGLARLSGAASRAGPVRRLAGKRTMRCEVVKSLSCERAVI
jgi:hypothetical protein